MGYILHMSDFHCGKNPTEEKARLTDLAAWITANKIPIDYLVFTGDMIDAPSVLLSCIRKLKKSDPAKFDYLKTTGGVDQDAILTAVRKAGADSIALYDAQLRETTLHSMEQAGKLFLEFIHQIDLDNRRVILCCGNHDRMRPAGEPAFSCDTGVVTEDIMAAPFEAYNALCSLVNDKLSYRTTVYSHEGINFVIANSNWNVPIKGSTNRMCVSCKALSNELSKLRKADSFDRQRNLFVAHKPFDDFCETVKYPYAGDLLTVGQQIHRTASAFLYGDKHSYCVKFNNELKEFMCGLPLSSGRGRYNLLDLDPTDGIRSCSYIINDAGGWTMVPITDCQESIYAQSKPYLKEYAFDLLAKSKTVPAQWDRVMEIMQAAHDGGTIRELSNLFTSFSDLRQGKHTIEYDPSVTLFDQFVSLITSSPLQAVSIKGRPGVGKSTFLTTEYLYMLWLFSSGKTRYIPFYFNFDSIAAELTDDMAAVNDVTTYITHCTDRFDAFLSGCRKLSETYRLPLCLFIDGLEKSKILAPGNTLEKQIYQLVETKLHHHEDKYVMAFSTHDSYNFEDSFEQINRFEYVLFMNRVRILPYKTKEPKQDLFLSSYLALTGKPTDDTVISALKTVLVKFRRPSIDLFFLHHCDKHIFSIKEDEEIWDVLKAHLDDLDLISLDLFKLQRDSIQQAVGLLFSQRKCYAEIVSTEGLKDLKITDFLTILNAPIITNYLIAKHFVQELVTYSNISNGKIPEDSILYSFMPHELSVLIRLILDWSSSADNTLARFINHHKDDLNGYLYSTISYLCGHLRKGDNDNLLSSLPPPDRTRNTFFTFCHRRSYDLAAAVHSGKKFPTETILLEFIDNESYRKFNRSYQLHYYQDASINSIRNQSEWNPDKPPQIGFDFRYSFLMLLSKLEPALLCAKPYPLMQLDLFTLCDLVYSRLQYVSPNGLFYSAKYNTRDDSECEAILARMVALLDKYNTLYGRKKSANSRIGAYFSLMHSRFETIKKSVTGNKGKQVDIPYVSPCYDFAQVLQLPTLARVGWNIDVLGEIKLENQPNYTADDAPPIMESLMQHVMESVYIAQLFLPEDLPEEDFQKSEVISLLLFSELGKTYNGDYSPNYSNYSKRKSMEETDLAHMSILGALDGYATQPTFIKPVSSDTAININMRICWEIKMIQREFKYYTLYHKLGFTDERRAEFEADFEEPTTNICKSIRDQLVLKNPDFKDLIGV